MRELLKWCAPRVAVLVWQRGWGPTLVAVRWLLARTDVRDILLLLGIGLLGFGLWQIWKPLPYIVIGALLIRLAVGPLLSSPPPPQEKHRRHGIR